MKKKIAGTHTIALHQSQSKVTVTLHFSEVYAICAKFAGNRKYIFKAKVCKDLCDR